MQNFIREQNLALYRRLLTEELDDEKRKIVQRLLDEEEKQLPPKAADGEN